MKKYLLFLFLLPLLTFGQTTQTFSTAGTSSFVVPNGVTSLDVQTWGGGGCSGHNTSAPSGSCGGGGGGAYTGGTISVSSGATFSYTVGAGGIYNTAGTTPPVAGSPSTFSVITANGGSRGGRSPSSNGGAGGTFSTDPGGVTSFVSRAGGNGGNGGNTASFSGGGGGGAAGTTAAGTNGAISALNTGGAGGAGGVNGGGAGGKGSDFSPVSNGFNGTAPGGGGGGRAYNNTGNNTNGGDGQIKITYTCTSYDVLTDAASATQFLSCGNSTVTLTSSSLPAGTYTVSYSTTNPVTSGNTATMIFSGTTGTFSTMTLTATSDITVNSLQSGSGVGCTSTITTNNTATAVLVVVTAGTIGTDQTICTGTAPATLTSDEDGSGLGTITYQWQARTLPAGYADISGATGATYQPPTITATTNYRRRTISSLNGVSCSSVQSNVVTVTVTANLSTVAITPTTAQNICHGSNGTQLSVGAPTDGGAFTRQWGKRSVSGGAITNIGTASGANYTPTGVSLGLGTWLVVCTVTPTCGSPTVSNEVSVTINPTPTLTGALQAATVCEGSVANINLTGLVASSTATVSYTIDIGSTQTITGVVADASGAASFTTAALTAANNGQVLQITGVTITSATPNCSATFTRNVTLSVTPNLSAVAITPSTEQTICPAGSGSSGAALTVAVTGGGAITRQWGKRAVSGGAITALSGETASTYTPTGASLGPGTWLVVCTTTATCGSPIVSNEVSVTVSAPLTLTGASQAASVCAGSAAVINLTGLVSNSTSTITYKIDGGTTRTINGVVADASGNASFTTFTTLTGANNGQTLQITGITIPSASPSCTTVFTQDITLSVIAPTIGSYSQSTTVCAGSSATILLTGMLPNTTSTIAYQLAGTPQPDITGVVSDASGNASFSIVATNAQNFRILSITSTSTTPNCTTPIGAGTSIPLVIETITAGSIGTAQTVCNGSAPATLTSVVAGTGSGTISYEWQADDGTGYVTISGATAANYSPPALTTTTSYKRRTISTPVSGAPCTSTYTTPITISVNNVTAGAINGTITVCSGNDRTIGNATGGSSTIGSATLSYEWQADNGTGYSTIPGAIEINYLTPILNITTSYKRRTVAVSNGVTCYSDYTTPVTIFVNSVNPGKIGTKQSICAGDTPAPLTSIIDGTGAGTITYEWQSRILPAIFEEIPGATGPTYSPGVTTVQTSYRRRVVSTLNGVICYSEFDALTIKVNEPDEGIIGTDQTICAGSTPATLTSIEAGTGAGTITYEWQTNAGGGPYVTISGATATTYAPPALTATTSYRRRTVGVCTTVPTYSIYTTPVTVTVNVVTAGTIGTNQTHCTATTPATLTSTAAGTGSGTVTYEWQTNASGSYLTIPGETAATYSPPNLTATTSYQRRTISTLNGVSCNSAYTTPVTITLDSNPATPTISAITNANCVSSTGTVTLAGLPATGTWTINPGAISGSGTSYTITGLSPATYTFTVTNANGCISNATNSATVTPAVTNTWNGTTWSKGTTSNLQSLIFDSNYPPAIDPNVDLYGCSCTVNTGNNVTIKTGRSLILTDQVNVVGSGTLSFENNASLIQINDVANTGNITYNRKSTTVRETDYTYWSSPVAGQNLLALSPTTKLDKFYFFNASANDWVQLNPSTTTMAIGVGYIIRGIPLPPIPPPGFPTYSFIGVPNNGTKTIAVVGGATSNLIGNPYPSAIDADDFLAANSASINGTIYFWTHNTEIQNASLITGVDEFGTPKAGSGALAYTSDDYATYNGTGGVANSGGAPPDGTIAAGQSFFTTSTPAGGPVTFTNSIRVNGLGNPLNNSNFYKTKNPKTSASIEKHRIWLNLTNTQGAFKQTLVGYIAGATNKWDNLFDGESFDGNQFVDFYSINQDKNLTIQGRALPFDENDEIPLGYRSAISGEFTISINKADGFLTNQTVFIEDKLNNSITNLKASNYSFKTTRGTFNDRFVLRFKDITLGTNDVLAQPNKVLVAVKNKQIKINSFAETIDKVIIYDLLGRKIYQKNQVSSDELLVMNFVSSHQTLIVKTTLQNGATVTNKIIY